MRAAAGRRPLSSGGEVDCPVSVAQRRELRRGLSAAGWLQEPPCCYWTRPQSPPILHAVRAKLRPQPSASMSVRTEAADRGIRLLKKGTEATLHERGGRAASRYSFTLSENETTLSWTRRGRPVRLSSGRDAADKPRPLAGTLPGVALALHAYVSVCSIPKTHVT